MRVTLNGLEFNCRLDGRGDAPWLVFSNSLMTNLSMWDAQVETFGAHFRILRYDQRGHGLTQVPPAAANFDQLSGDLLALIDKFAIARALIVGVSMGGSTALRLASEHPGRVAGVVAADCQWCSPDTAVAQWDERIALARNDGMLALVEPTINRWFTPAFVADGSPALHEVRKMIASTPVEGLVACASALQRYDLRPAVRSIRVPVCFIVGERDGVMPAVMAEMHRAVPASTWVAIPEAGHLPNVERPAAFGAAVASFCASIGALPQ